MRKPQTKTPRPRKPRAMKNIPHPGAEARAHATHARHDPKFAEALVKAQADHAAEALKSSTPVQHAEPGPSPAVQ
jgi:hypothetical protein